MGQDRQSDWRTAALGYGVLAGVVLAYGAAVVGGFFAVFRASAWIDAAVLQPLVGGSELLSLALFAAVQLGYVWAVFRLTTSGTTVGPSGNSDSAWWQIMDGD